MITEERFSKLPKWAQSEITVLRMNLESAKKELSQVEGKEETNTRLRKGLDYQRLPNNSRIEFKVQGGKIDVYVQPDGKLNINGHGIGDIVILPRASNSFFITFMDN